MHYPTICAQFKILTK